jgi:hypothetical protein
MGCMQNLCNHLYVRDECLVSALIRNVSKTLTKNESFTFRKHIQGADRILLRLLLKLKPEIILKIAGVSSF